MTLVSEKIESAQAKQASGLPVTRHYVDGAFCDGGERRAPVYNPATGDKRAEVLLADVATVDRAVAAARRALPEWRDTSLGKRAKVLFAFR